MKGRWPGLIVGLAVTAAACALYATGAAKPLVFRALDVHFKEFNHLDASDRILHIAITDEAIEKWGRWPWSRATLAEIIDTLHECGARIIALDLILPEPEPDELRDSSRDPYADLIGEVRTIGTPAEIDWVEGDRMLAAAMRRAGSVFVGIDFEVARPAGPLNPKEQAAARIAPLLYEDFELDLDEILARIGDQAPPEGFENIQKDLPNVKRRVAMERVEAICSTRPALSYDQVHRLLLTTPLDERNTDTADVKAAYARFRGVRAALSHCGPVPSEMEGRIPRIRRFTPPWYEIGEVARQVGFVEYDRNQVGGVVRYQQLVGDYNGHLLKQLGFAVVCEYLGIRDDRMRIDDNGDLVIVGEPADQPDIRVPLNEKGQMLVNWQNAGGWDKSFGPLPVEKVLEVVDLRRKRDDNLRNLEHLHGHIAQTFLAGEEKLKYDALGKRIMALRLQLRELDYDAAPVAERAETRRRLDAAIAARDAKDRELAEFVTANHEAIEGETPQGDDERAEFDRIRAAFDHIRFTIPRFLAANQKNRAEEQAALSELREKIRGKICVVGYTATAVADFMVTPLFNHTPGSMMHINIINTFMQNTFVRLVPKQDAWKVTGLIAMAGLVTVLVTLCVGPVVSLTFVITLMTVYFFVHALVVWERGHLFLASVTPLATIFVNWAFVTLYRQLTEERSKRHVAKALGQYTSPAIAQTIVEASTDLSPQEGVVTCFFSDLQGFTTISETLGAERTKAILNPYLEAMSAVLIEHGAMINKFIGDAVFAFFNPPLFACPQHARAACESAIDSMAALERLKTGEQYPELKADLQRLYMRIGVNSGPVFVGDYGSENKLDYTCIGDTVNLAARLEPANKVFGTWVMISESTYADTNGDFEVRHLGGLQVKGKAQAIQVYELLGRAGELDDEPRRYAERFGAAVAKFQQRDFAAAETAFLACLDMRSGDPGAKRYLATIDQYKTAPPSDDWNGAIELTEK